MLDLGSRDDLVYLEAVIDCSPLCVTRRDAGESYTEYQRELLKKLIAIAKEHARCRGGRGASAEAGNPVGDGEADGRDSDLCSPSNPAPSTEFESESVS